MRLLSLLLIVAVAAYYTNPPRERYETEASAELQARADIARNDPQAAQRGFSLDDVVGYVKGMMAGQGAYEDYYVAGKYTVDMPGADYLECYGAFTVVKCQVKSE
jgi:hypothetical protein